MKDVTIKDIADFANVSKSTVSRVLNGTAAVHPEKREAVLNATARLGFRPNFAARSLANGKSMTIGVMTQLMGSPFYDTISQGVISALSGTGYSPMFVDGQWQQDDEVDALKAILSRSVDGLILIGGDVPESDITDLCGELPVVVVARELPSESIFCIHTDNVAGGHTATAHLIGLGHRDIAIIKGVSHHPDAVDRVTGYENALSEAGISINPKLICDGDFTAESGIAAINQLVENNIHFTAVFTSNDTTAFGARLALDRHGIRVPQDVSLVGFDDQMESAFMTPPLTTIYQPAREMGRAASNAVMSLINKEEPAEVSTNAVLQVRESTATVRPRATVGSS